MLKSYLAIVCYDLSHIFVAFNKDKNKNIQHYENNNKRSKNRIKYISL